MSTDELAAQIAKFLEKHEQISTLSDAEAWCSEADEVLQSLDAGCKQLDEFLALQSDQVAGLRQQATSSRLGWIFRSKEEKAVLASIEAVKAEKETFFRLMRTLHDLRTVTPATAQERVRLLKELRADRKRLQLQKREIGASIAEVRLAARAKSANAPYSPMSLLMGSVADRRKQVRFTKEVQLRPLEQQRAEIEARILEVQRKIIRLEAIH